MFVVARRSRCSEDDHGEGTPRHCDRNMDGRADAKPQNQERQLIVHVLSTKPLWRQLAMEFGASCSHHATAGSCHSVGAPDLEIPKGSEQFRVRGVEDAETRLALRIPQM